ncbi:S8/S53 family peptidase [Sphaerisporangium sp. TRM90804]|uniref:S8/S53 family peptidase n=1 Tax=Sphaerisporangium sp. TRM90804 TaxID=3031113 RepID=UPI002449E7A2|nr:S8/S53 family peptidase [Sphaerisporangium sp. TRM90804]MDH2427356.1 S8/S53 family peptidase [Sphaerisporangium sp. TRM90804]
MALDRFREQMRLISEAMGGVELVAGPHDDDPRYIYQSGHVLARVEELPDVVPAVNVGRTESVRVPHESEARAGLVRIEVVDPSLSDSRDGGVTETLGKLREMETRNGRRMLSRNNVVAITPGVVNSCPSDEPAPTDADLHPRPSMTGAALSGVEVMIIDTGLLQGFETEHPWMAHVRAEGFNKPAFADGHIPMYAGHGTFIAGLLVAVAPSARVRVSAALNDAGSILEDDFGQTLLDALGPDWPAVISLSAGTESDDGGPLMGLEDFMRELDVREGTLLVAAAGNNGSDVPFWPAAHTLTPHRAGVLSVGALRADGDGSACFSNHGDWVSVFAPGERLVGPFAGRAGTDDPYLYQHSTFDHCRYKLDPDDPRPFYYDCTCGFPPRVGRLSVEDADSPARVSTAEFDGRAIWSGTSFATPLVAAMVVNYMLEKNVSDPRAAARDLIQDRSEHVTVRGRRARALRPDGWDAQPVAAFPPLPAPPQP